MTPIRIVTVPQADRGTRYLAIPRAEYERLRRDRSLIESVGALGCLDVDRDGTRTWARTGPLYQAIPSDVREALREASR